IRDADDNALVGQLEKQVVVAGGKAFDLQDARLHTQRFEPVSYVGPVTQFEQREKVALRFALAEGGMRNFDRLTRGRMQGAVERLLVDREIPTARQVAG